MYKLRKLNGDIGLVEHPDGVLYWYKFGPLVTTYVLAENVPDPLPSVKTMFKTADAMNVWFTYDRTFPLAA